MNDLRFAFRQLLKNPGFTAVAVLTLALGIGANTAIFSMIDTVLLKNLPVKDPERLVGLAVTPGESGREQIILFSYPLFQALRERNQVFSGMLAYGGGSLNLSASTQTERVSGNLVSGNFFSVLGVEPHLGRFFSDEDDPTPGGSPEAILSYNFWTRRFAGDPTLIGKTIRLNGYPFTVAGISPPGFFGVEVGSAPEVWIPMAMHAQLFPGRDRLLLWDHLWIKIMARLKPGASEQVAQAGTEVLCQQIYQEAPGLNPRLRSSFSEQHIRLHPVSKGLSSLRREFQQPLLILMTAVALVLLIACANVANLLLARGTARQKEIAVRLALGASRSRLVRQLLTESTLLSLLGALSGLLLASWANGLLLRFLAHTGSALDLHPDLRVLGFNVGVALLTGLLFGLAPALKATRPNLTVALKNETPTLARGLRRLELRKILVVAQVAVTLVLLIGAGLFVRTLQNLKGVDLGFHADKVLLLSMNPGLSRYSSNQVVSFYAQLLARVKSLPDVQSASIADMPLLGGAYVDGVTVEGYQPSPDENMGTKAKRVEPKFFEAMGIPLRMGRDFLAQDGPGSAKVAIINQTFARHFFGTNIPLGKRVGVGTRKPDCEIIGVIQDTKYGDLKEQAPRTVYVPFAQSDSARGERTLHVRTTGNPKNLITAIRREVQALDKDLPVYDVRTFTDLIAKNLSQERLIAALSSLFGLLALLLASIGLYGLMAHAVARRTREIGIRMALGARPASVLWLVLRETLILVGIGIGVGLPAAFGVTRLVASRLFGLSPTDPTTLLFATTVLGIVALFAGYWPARRATRVDPTEALRCE